MCAAEGQVKRSYRVGTAAVVPPELLADLPAHEVTSATYILIGQITRIFGTYLENQSRIVASLCQQYGGAVVAAKPAATDHYGTLRQITGTSANIADSAHAYLKWSYQQYLTMDRKLGDFLNVLMQDSLEGIRYGWLATGYLPTWFAHNLARRWHLKDHTWVKNTARGWHHQAEAHALWPSILGTRQHPRQFSEAQWAEAWTCCLTRLTTLIDARNAQGRNTSRLRGLRNALSRVGQHGLSFLAREGICGTTSALRGIAGDLVTCCGPGHYLGALGMLFAEACCARIGASLSKALLLNLQQVKDDLLTAPFAAGRASRKYVLPAIILTSPRYILKRLNGAAMTSAIRAGQEIFLELPRRPKTAASLRLSYASLLTPTHRSLLKDEFPRLDLEEIFPQVSPNERPAGWGSSRSLLRPRKDSSPGNRPGTYAVLRQKMRFRLKRWLGLPFTPGEQAWIHAHDPGCFLLPTRQGLALRLRLHPAVLRRIQEGGEISQLLVHPPQRADKKTIVVLQLHGTAQALIHSPQGLHALLTRLVQQAEAGAELDILAVDLNRLSNCALTFGGLKPDGTPVQGLEVKAFFGAEFVRINRCLTACDREVSAVQSALHRYGQDPIRREKLRGQFSLLHRRRAHLKQTAEFLAALELFLRIKLYRPRVVARENLTGFSTRGKRGRLAKIVNYMVKRGQYLEDLVQGWVTADPTCPVISWQAVDPRNTSRLHFGCGGVIQRDHSQGQWDRAPCGRCQVIVDTQANSPLQIALKARILDPADPP